MTNELKTRRLIVTLPNTSGEEADAISSELEHYIGANATGYGVLGATVEHALGETLPDGVICRRNKALRDLIVVGDKLYSKYAIDINRSEARQLAGALLALADEIEGQE